MNEQPTCNHDPVEIANEIMLAAGLEAYFYRREDGTVSDGGTKWDESEFDAEEATDAAENLVYQSTES